MDTPTVIEHTRRWFAVRRRPLRGYLRQRPLRKMLSAGKGCADTHRTRVISSLKPQTAVAAALLFLKCTGLEGSAAADRGPGYPHPKSKIFPRLSFCGQTAQSSARCGPTLKSRYPIFLNSTVSGGLTSARLCCTCNPPTLKGPPSRPSPHVQQWFALR